MISKSEKTNPISNAMRAFTLNAGMVKLLKDANIEIIFVSSGYISA